MSATALLAATSCGAESPLGPLDEVARTFGYPANKLVAKDLTENFRVKYGDDILSAYEYSSYDNTFVPITVTVARQGVLLTPELRIRLKKTLQTNFPDEPSARETLKLITLSNRVEGFVGTEGFDSSQERWHLVLTVPHHRFDMHMSAAAAPNETLLDVEPGTSRYHKRACAGGDAWWGQLLDAGWLGIERLSREPSMIATQTVAADREAVVALTVDSQVWADSAVASLQAVRTAIEGGPSRWLLLGTCAWLVIGVLAARVGIYGK